MFASIACVHPSSGLGTETVTDNPQAGSPVPSTCQLQCSQGKAEMHPELAPCSSKKIRPEFEGRCASGQVRPRRLGIQHSPPALVIEYTLSHEVEEQLHIHRVSVDARMVQFNIRDLVRALKKHPMHEPFVKNVQKDQLKVLLNRLRVVVASDPLCKPTAGQQNLVATGQGKPAPQSTMAESPVADVRCSLQSEPAESPSPEPNVRCRLEQGPAESSRSPILDACNSRQSDIAASPSSVTDITCSQHSALAASASPVGDVRCSPPREPASTSSPMADAVYTPHSELAASPSLDAESQRSAVFEPAKSRSIVHVAVATPPVAMPPVKRAEIESSPSAVEPSESPEAAAHRRRGSARRRSRSGPLPTRLSLAYVSASPAELPKNACLGEGASSNGPLSRSTTPADALPEVQAPECHLPSPSKRLAQTAAELHDDYHTASSAESQAADEAGDAWPSDAWTTWSRSYASASGTGGKEIGDLFEAFRTSRGVEAIAASFARLLHAAEVSHPVAGVSRMPLDTIRAAVGEHRRLARVLWERLDARRAEAEYCDRPLAGHHVVVVGSGPVGLRSALEMRLLGAEVVVLEVRESFDRINRLHLWPWCGEDLKRWGAKVLEPPELSFGADADFLHIGIAELQMLLLKSCLLFGVQVFFGAEYLGPVPHTTRTCRSAGWDVCVTPSTRDSTGKLLGPSSPSRLRGVTVLVGADGPRGRVAKAHGLELQETSGLRKEAALGLVANYKNCNTPAEKSRRPFSLARQFYDQLFKDCEQETGVELENVVCYISPQTHYFVMTPTRRSLQRCGVFAETASEGELMKTLDQEALARAARAVAAFSWKSGERPMPEASLDSPVGPASLFDFSRQRRAATGIRIVEGPSINGEKPSSMLVGLCGDALIEPFWPEGLGVVRGFFGALDLASAARLWAQTGDAKLAVSHFETAFRQLKSLAAKTRGAVLKPDAEAYGLDPSTRYRGLASAVGSHLRASSTGRLCP